mmetsp:Transcript_2581/g.5884  ORF Transcript_2581/g.5884 Transcript_2581/m.5884 type:complete len:465 (+) Transcript_2581:70-1464(+)
MGKMISFSSALTFLLLCYQERESSLTLAFSHPSSLTSKSILGTATTATASTNTPLRSQPTRKKHDSRLWNEFRSNDVMEGKASPMIVNGDGHSPKISDGKKTDETAASQADSSSMDPSQTSSLLAQESSVSPDSNKDFIDPTNNAKSNKPPFPIVLWRFTRPHTLIGSAIAIPSIFLLASPTYSSFFTLSSLQSLAYAVFPSLLMNLYITGLNQITDVEIDKINKPELVIAKGDLGKGTAIGIVLVALLASLIMSVTHPLYSTAGLQVALWGSFLLGTMYSLPPFRMKRHPLLAAFCIVAVRGTIINAGFYSHALSSAFGKSMGVMNCLKNDWKCSLSSLFFGVFGIVIALMKDVPDAHGDRIFNIKSFTVRVGQTKVFRTMKNLLTILFGVFGAALMQWAFMAPNLFVGARRGLVGCLCWLAGWSTRKEAKGVDAEDSVEVYDYYMHLWKLFYLSYLVLPFAK